jgi:ribosomal protein L24E
MRSFKTTINGKGNTFVQDEGTHIQKTNNKFCIPKMIKAQKTPKKKEAKK